MSPIQCLTNHRYRPCTVDLFQNSASPRVRLSFVKDETDCSRGHAKSVNVPSRNLHRWAKKAPILNLFDSTSTWNGQVSSRIATVLNQPSGLTEHSNVRRVMSSCEIRARIFIPRPFPVRIPSIFFHGIQISSSSACCAIFTVFIMKELELSPEPASSNEHL